MKLSALTWLGVAACILLMIACFMPWAYFADSNIPSEAERTFTGFYSFKNNYGRPGYYLEGVAIISLVLLVVRSTTAKMVNLFLAAFTFAYAIKTYTLFISCYNAYCPEKKPGIFLMLAATLLILIASVFQKTKVKPPQEEADAK
ncbi:MAG: hypothetical protein JST86_15730 [Bacteroidetes bacterium]|nr:hypothetical protein [Bacteroidota bacterium]